jgi:hypothetical protein
MKWWKKLLAAIEKWMNAEQKKKLPTTLPEPEKPVAPTPAKCACDLSKSFQTPPYDPDELDRMGNKSECPTIQGRDVRLACKRANAPTPWLLGMLLARACNFNGNNMSAKCFEADNGQYHFLGYSRKFDGSDFIATTAGTEFPYKTTTFIWYEWRAK